jgi:CheY-like chemotaxis protein
MTKILIVDDDHTMAGLLKTLLELDGFDVVHEIRPGLLVSTVRAEKPDVVLMDIFMIESYGLDLLTQLRAEKDLTEIRVVMTSGMELGIQARAAGADAFLLKPYTPEQLMLAIGGGADKSGSG